MTISYELDRKLGVFELRASFLEHNRRACAMLPPPTSRPRRILDVGCGTGAPSIELIGTVPRTHFHTCWRSVPS